LWGVAEAREAAAVHGLGYIEAIEVSARLNDIGIHVLGYSAAFDVAAMHTGLRETRAGYERRALRMVELCGEAGYELSEAQLRERRAGQAEPVYMAYDVAALLTEHHGLSIIGARKLTTHGGSCHVPYGEWALSVADAIGLIHAAGGLAVLAHPGTIAHEASDGDLQEILASAVSADLDGIEVVHPFHTKEVEQQVRSYAASHDLVQTSGSDWHGPGRYHEGALGTYGVSVEEWERLHARLRSRFPQE